jgi:hypothetical protein
MDVPEYHGDVLRLLATIHLNNSLDVVVLGQGGPDLARYCAFGLLLAVRDNVDLKAVP